VARPGYGFEHIDEGARPVRAFVLERCQFDVKAPHECITSAIAEYFSRVDDVRSHGVALKVQHPDIATECPDVSKYCVTVALSFFAFAWPHQSNDIGPVKVSTQEVWSPEELVERTSRRGGGNGDRHSGPN
jgi:hypothetical protein